MELNINEARIPQALPVEITFAHSAQCGLLSFGIFTRYGAVSRGWRDAVDAALRMFVHSTGLVTHRKHRLLRDACCTLRAAGCWPLPVPLRAAFCGLHVTFPMHATSMHKNADQQYTSAPYSVDLTEGQADWRVEKVVAACLASLSLMRACFCCSCSRCCRLLCYWDVLLLQMLPMMLIVLDPVVDDIIGLLLC